MNNEIRRESNAKGEDSMFSRQECIDNILTSAFTYQGDDSTGALCPDCGEEISDWDLPVGYMQPPHMHNRPLCVACWANAAADVWEEEEADQRAAEESVGSL
jgi:hypothetical protein